MRVSPRAEVPAPCRLVRQEAQSCERERRTRSRPAPCQLAWQERKSAAGCGKTSSPAAGGGGRGREGVFRRSPYSLTRLLHLPDEQAGVETVGHAPARVPVLRSVAAPPRWTSYGVNRCDFHHRIARLVGRHRKRLRQRAGNDLPAPPACGSAYRFAVVPPTPSSPRMAQQYHG